MRLSHTRTTSRKGRPKALRVLLRLPRAVRASTTKKPKAFSWLAARRSLVQWRTETRSHEVRAAAYDAKVELSAEDTADTVALEQQRLLFIGDHG
jgi:hypothetical protein